MTNDDKQVLRKAARRYLNCGEAMAETIAGIAVGIRPAGETPYGWFTQTDALECVAEWEADRERERKADPIAYAYNWAWFKG